MDGLQSLGRAHEDARVAHHQVAAFDNFDAHLPRQIGVLEIGAVVGAGRQQDDGGIGHARRRDVLQHLQQFLRDNDPPAARRCARTCRENCASSPGGFPARN
jgi:hypothetical protein